MTVRRSGAPCRRTAGRAASVIAAAVVAVALARAGCHGLPGPGGAGRAMRARARRHRARCASFRSPLIASELPRACSRWSSAAPSRPPAGWCPAMPEPWLRGGSCSCGPLSTWRAALRAGPGTGLRLACRWPAATVVDPAGCAGGRTRSWRTMWMVRRITTVRTSTAGLRAASAACCGVGAQRVAHADCGDHGDHCTGGSCLVGLHQAPRRRLVATLGGQCARALSRARESSGKELAKLTISLPSPSPAPYPRSPICGP